MARDPSSPSDPGRLVALLWVAEPADATPVPLRGRPSRLDIRQIVEAAIGLADALGLEGLTMRALAGALRSSPMALYAHVPSRADLLVLMLDRACAAMSRREPEGAGWRARVEAVVRDHRDLILNHPWIAELPATRPPPGPGQIAKYDRDLRALDELGLGAVELDRTLAALLDLGSGSARQAVAARRERGGSGLTDEEWWAALAPHLERAFDPERFPLAARVGTAAATATGGAYDPNATFEHGLVLMLDGLEDRLRRQGGVRQS